MIYALIIIDILFILFAIYCFKLIKNSDNEKNYKISKILLISIAIIMVIINIIKLVNGFFCDNLFLTIAILLSVIADCVFLVFFFGYSIDLLKNFNKDVIFDRNNVKIINGLSYLFIAYSVFTIISGMTISLIEFINGESISFSISIYPIFFILMGVVFHIIAFFFNKSIDIYEENKLTI